MAFRGGRGRLVAAVTLALVALGIATVPALAGGPFYAHGSVGYDSSVYQCGAPARGAFGIVAVTSGRPFTRNGCVAAELAGAPGPPSVYMNTGYSPTYAARITTGCDIRSSSVSGTELQRQAYAIGCSEAEIARDWLRTAAGKRVRTWWLDVETANSWSATNLVLNRAVLRGAIDFLKARGAVLGLYSTSRQWTEITGGWAAPGLDANWVAGAGSPAEAVLMCASSITGAPVWLVQYVRAGLDVDRAC
jgi:hypothetical protein